MRLTEIASDLVRPPLGAPEEAPDIARQLPEVARPLAPHRVGLDVLVEKFVRVEMGAVPRQEEQANPPPMVLDPPLCIRGDVCGMGVKDEEDLPPGVAKEPPQEGHKHRRVETALEHHEREPPPVGDRRDHVASEALPRARDHRRLPATPVRAPGLMVRAHPGLVAPEDRRLLPTGQGADGRILPLEPSVHRLGILFVGPPDGFLRSEAPAPEVATDCPDGEAQAELPGHQVAYRLSCPEHKWHLELVRTAIRDQADRRCRLVRFQFQHAWTPSRARAKRPKTSFAPAAIPRVHRLPGNAKNTGRPGLRHPGPYSPHHPKAEGLLSLDRKMACIQRPHASNNATK